MGKFYGYGIVDKDGEPVPMHHGLKKDTCKAIVDYWNYPANPVHGHPHRVVELFYKDAE